ncbi:hypothetical protein KL944_002715 [Ogataea haglerorum]|nr:hypothetical protein KL944_002715 [Ogataea haglerorum]
MLFVENFHKHECALPASSGHNSGKTQHGRQERSRGRPARPQRRQGAQAHVAGRVRGAAQLDAAADAQQRRAGGAQVPGAVQGVSGPHAARRRGLLAVDDRRVPEPRPDRAARPVLGARARGAPEVPRQGAGRAGRGDPGRVQAARADHQPAVGEPSHRPEAAGRGRPPGPLHQAVEALDAAVHLRRVQRPAHHRPGADGRAPETGGEGGGRSVQRRVRGQQVGAGDDHQQPAERQAARGGGHGRRADGQGADGLRGAARAEAGPGGDAERAGQPDGAGRGRAVADPQHRHRGHRLRPGAGDVRDSGQRRLY